MPLSRVYRSLSAPVRRQLVPFTFLCLALAAGPVTATWAQSSGTPPTFAQVGLFAVPSSGIAEIVAATPDGRTLVYSNATGQAVGLVDIADPARPRHIASVPMPGEATSVVVSPRGDVALVAVISSAREFGERAIVRPGQLVVLDLATRQVRGSVSIGNQPDSVALVPTDDGSLVAVVAIENEPLVVDAAGIRAAVEVPDRAGDVSGPGYVQIVTVDVQQPARSLVRNVMFDPVALAAAGLYYPHDPQPEYVAVKGNRAAVTLQENNGLAILDIASARVEWVFSTGVVADRLADLTDNRSISLTQRYPSDARAPFAGARFPDAVAWGSSGQVLYTADEGEFDYTGGRGWSAWSLDGRFLWDDGGSLEAEAVRQNRYPDGRSDAKGIEVEGVVTAIYGGAELAFVGSERGSFIAIYELVSARAPRFLQLLPTGGTSPEGLLAIPQRGLFVTSEEVSGTITIYQAQ